MRVRSSGDTPLIGFYGCPICRVQGMERVGPFRSKLFVVTFLSAISVSILIVSDER